MVAEENLWRGPFMSEAVSCVPLRLCVFANPIIGPIDQTGMHRIRCVQLVIATTKVVLEVDVVHIRERHRQWRGLRRETQAHRLSGPIVFVVEKPERFVLDDRAADVAAKHFHPALRIFLPIQFQEIVRCVQAIVLKKGKYPAVKLIGSTVGDGVDNDT